MSDTFTESPPGDLAGGFDETAVSPDDPAAITEFYAERMAEDREIELTIDEFEQQLAADAAEEQQQLREIGPEQWAEAQAEALAEQRIAAVEQFIEDQLGPGWQELIDRESPAAPIEAAFDHQVAERRNELIAEDFNARLVASRHPDVDPVLTARAAENAFAEFTALTGLSGREGASAVIDAAADVVRDFNAQQQREQDGRGVQFDEIERLADVYRADVELADVAMYADDLWSANPTDDVDESLRLIRDAFLKLAGPQVRVSLDATSGASAHTRDAAQRIKAALRRESQARPAPERVQVRTSSSPAGGIPSGITRRYAERARAIGATVRDPRHELEGRVA